MSNRVVSLLVLAGLIVGSCGGGKESADPTEAKVTSSSVIATTVIPTTSVVSTTTSQSSTTSSELAPAMMASDLVYHQNDDRFVGDGLVDVVARTTDGPVPVVVAFHIHDTSRRTMLPMATDIAAEDRVVFVPEWGHPAGSWLARNTLEARYDLYVEEIRCAVAFAKAHAADYGGDPDHITVFGQFFGANAAMMASLADTDPLETCIETGPSVVPQAVVSLDGVYLLDAPDWDSLLTTEPEAFYAFTPWRYLDSSHEFPVHVATSEISDVNERILGSDPPASVIGSRHVDIDLVGELYEMGLLEDGRLTLRDSNQWAYQTLLDAGYDARWVLLPDSTPGSPSAEALDLIIATVVHAEHE